MNIHVRAVHPFPHIEKASNDPLIVKYMTRKHAGKGYIHQRMVNIGLNAEGERYRPLERMEDYLHGLEPAQKFLFEPIRRAELVRSSVPEMIRRELAHAGVLAEDASFSARLLAWVEVV